MGLGFPKNVAEQWFLVIQESTALKAVPPEVVGIVYVTAQQQKKKRYSSDGKSISIMVEVWVSNGTHPHQHVHCISPCSLDLHLPKRLSTFSCIYGSFVSLL